jgi:formylglycine-generating enzyme required for sulfatase activity
MTNDERSILMHPWISAPDIEQHDWLIENKKDSSLLVLVPGGRFLAGTKANVERGEEPFEVELPAFEVELPAYYMGLTCVTNEQFALFLNDAKPGDEELKRWVPLLPSYCKITKMAAGGYEVPSRYKRDAVVGVSWMGAEAYCTWAELRLPSELEWEKAARYVDGREYPWGDEWNRLLCSNSVEVEGGIFRFVYGYPKGTSEWGCYRMGGNVTEWGADAYDLNTYVRYRKGDLTPERVAQGWHQRIVRGSSNRDNRPGSFRCAARCPGMPDQGNGDRGFRVARSVL